MNDETNWGEEQKNPGQQPPRYQHYQFHEESRTALTTPDPSDNKKNRNSFQKKSRNYDRTGCDFRAGGIGSISGGKLTADQTFRCRQI